MSTHNNLVLHTRDNDEICTVKGKVSYAHEGDAGMDVFSNEKNDIILAPGDIYAVNTGVRLLFPQGSPYYASVVPRSGMAIKKGITVINSPGTIDAGYTGEVKVGLINLSTNTATISPGDKIAQILFHINPVDTSTLTYKKEERGEKGFGSTGYREVVQ